VGEINTERESESDMNEYKTWKRFGIEEQSDSDLDVYEQER
jgi:hypothetical protein